MKRCVLALLAAVLANSVAAQAAGPKAPAWGDDGYFWRDKERGWFWYEVLPREVEEKPQNELPAPTAKPAIPRKELELIEFEDLQKRLDKYRNIAIINPSEANVRRYMELESYVVAKASHFADVAQQVAWATPELDNTLNGRPVNAKALEVWDQQQSQERAQTLGELSRDHVIFFFFRGDCPYCHAYAPILRDFAAKFAMTVVPISVDGGGLPEYPTPRADNGIATTLKVTQVPATFLAQPFTGTIAPIGFGVLSESQLIERFSMVATPAAEALAPSTTRYLSPAIAEALSPRQ